MTIPECSIEKSASVLVDIFGDAAPAHARERMDEYEPGARKEGRRFWSAVAEAAARLLERDREQEPAQSARQTGFESTGAPVPLHARILRLSMVRRPG